MIQGINAPPFVSFDRHRPPRELFSQTILAVGALAFCSLAGFWMLHEHSPETARLARTPGVESASKPLGALLIDLRSNAGRRSARTSLAQTSQWDLRFDSTLDARAEPEDPQPRQVATASQQEEGLPLPPRRPAEYASSISRSSPSPASTREVAQQNRRTVPAAAPEERNVFEKFFGALQPSEPKASSPALAYAAPETGILDTMRRITSSPPSGYDQWTAVYDISSHTVYLPNGTKLEAHSGLGDKMDDPRYVHVKMRGSTPPSVYELSFRERLFHGVQALRLTPTGRGQVFGRAGLLAHTYMLGPRGDSNGCVSFRNYDAFLRAFQNGEIKRLAVVARSG